MNINILYFKKTADKEFQKVKAFLHIFNLQK